MRKLQVSGSIYRVQGQEELMLLKYYVGHLIYFDWQRIGLLVVDTDGGGNGGQVFQGDPQMCT